VSELARARFSAPLQITLPLAASAHETIAMLERAAGGPLSPASDVAVTAELAPRRALRRVGPTRAPVQVRLVTPGLRRLALPGDPIAWLAPGQPSPVFHLLERRAGDANIHTCEPTPAGIVEGLRRALQFQAAYPPLHGAPRPPRALRHDERAGRLDRVEAPSDHVSARADVPAAAMARERHGRYRPDTGFTGELFAAQCVSEARDFGLFGGEVDRWQQAFGYAMTAFAIGVRPPRAIGAPDGDWAPATRAVARVMLALASSDEEITDRVYRGEGRGARRARLAASVDYLIARIRGEPRELPEVRGKDILQSIGAPGSGSSPRSPRRRTRRFSPP
jgi:hypothetical protein